MRKRLSEQELVTHRETIARKMDEQNLDLLCLFGPRGIFYLTGLYLIQTERPVGLLFDGEETTAFVPLLEKEHVEQLDKVDHIVAYDEYPGEKHPMKILAQEIEQKQVHRLGVDSSGYGGGFGYEGPSLADLLDLEIEEFPRMIEKIMRVKSQEEIELIKESARWGNLAHRYLQDYTEPGKTENEIATRASQRASQVMLKTLGENYYGPKGGTTPASAGFRGQIGQRSALPHALATNETVKQGDVLVTGASAYVGGYLSELERAMIVGEPSEKQAKYFQLMVEAGDIALEKVKPGAKFSEVDRAVWEFYQANDLENYWRHHTGHSIGFDGHEAPYFDRHDTREIKEGMVVTVEPGLYIPDFAGFRHSDTVVVTEEGAELVTYYPRDLESLTIPVR